MGSGGGEDGGCGIFFPFLFALFVVEAVLLLFSLRISCFLPSFLPSFLSFSLSFCCLDACALVILRCWKNEKRFSPERSANSIPRLNGIQAEYFVPEGFRVLNMFRGTSAIYICLLSVLRRGTTVKWSKFSATVVDLRGTSTCVGHMG